MEKKYFRPKLIPDSSRKHIPSTATQLRALIFTAIETMQDIVLCMSKIVGNRVSTATRRNYNTKFQSLKIQELILMKRVPTMFFHFVNKGDITQKRGPGEKPGPRGREER